MLTRAIAVALVLVAAVILVLRGMSPPAPVPATAPATEFSAERAMHTLADLASRPHPTGTPAADAVRASIVRQLEGLGFAVEVQDTTSINESYAKKFGGPVVAAHVQNILARRPGTTPGPALMLMAHYDSRELAPGASDDGYGTATLLETARALAASAPLKHDVILLFTEGEEQGLLGAKAFVEESPVVKDVALALNFEARGDAGAVFMFQTSEHAGALVDVLATAGTPVVASSLSQEVYRRMPNDTDLTVWLRAGREGMNFANVDGFARYHQATDTVANADPGTLQQHGAYALALTRAFGDRDVVLPPAGPDEVYFTLGGPLFVHYAVRDAPTFAGFGVSLLVIALGVGVWRGRLHLGPTLAGVVVVLLALAGAGLVGAGVWSLVGPSNHGALGSPQVRDVLRTEAVAGFLLLGAAVVAGALAAAAGRAMRVEHVGFGATLVLAVLAVASCAIVPGGSYLFTWPLVIGAAAWCARIALPSLPPTGVVAIAVHLVSVVVTIVLVLPIGLLLGVVFGPVAAPAFAVLGGLLAATAAPLFDACTRGRTWVAPATLGVGSVGALAAACLGAPYDTAFPTPSSLVYAIDADHGAAWWLTFDEHDDGSDAWTGKALQGATRAALPELFPRSHATPLHAPAALITPEPLRIGIASDERAGDTRTLHLHLTLPTDVEVALLDVPAAAQVTSASVQGKPFSLEPSDAWLELMFAGPPATGLDLVLTTTSTAPVPLRILTQSRGLPADLAAPFGPRPPGTMPSIGPRGAMRASDMTLTTTSFDL